jgi:hypothetical protein
MPRSIHLPSFDDPNTNWWEVDLQIVHLSLQALLVLFSWIRTQVKYLPLIIEHSLSSSLFDISLCWCGE